MGLVFIKSNADGRWFQYVALSKLEILVGDQEFMSCEWGHDFHAFYKNNMTDYIIESNTI